MCFYPLLQGDTPFPRERAENNCRECGKILSHKHHFCHDTTTSERRAVRGDGDLKNPLYSDETVNQIRMDKQVLKNKPKKSQPFSEKDMLLKCPLHTKKVSTFSVKMSSSSVKVSIFLGDVVNKISTEKGDFIAIYRPSTPCYAW